MTAETRTQTPDAVAPERIVRREDFGPGHAGELSYQTVLMGLPCVAYIDVNKTECGKPPIGTIDVDISSDVNPFPICSEEHALILTEQIVNELTEKGQPGISGIGRNGFGRA